ncbi:DUF1877 family protein [Oculatella sp. LEGE 06141]|uniref:DUF1877 family protein n=1 Tax=Oculatella sp. LEGE 06141 TaxID=1828648 RepID=UPI00187EBB4B|nr:DUF1877 family protein [Oculatella sp. LEGE 06141]MBE9179285.1 DUF1877 family protein [Oculatella sp. LEGE 06141]
MGLDIHYQAMPESSNLLERARHEPRIGSNLEFFKSYALTTQKQLDDRIYEQHIVDFIYQARQSLEQYLGIEYRNLYLGRRWDTLYYLLSERRRKGEERDWSQWVEKAIFGGEVLNEETQTTIGFPIRYLYPTEVLKVRDNLKAVTPAMLHGHWNPYKMNEAGVYKIRGDEDENYFTWIKEDLEKLKTFYDSIAEHDEGVLAFMG